MKILVAVLQDMPAQVIIADNPQKLFNKLVEWYAEDGITREQLEEEWEDEIDEDDLLTMDEDTSKYFGDWGIWYKEV